MIKKSTSHISYSSSAVAFKSWWQWPHTKLGTASIPLMGLTCHTQLSFPTVPFSIIGSRQNRSARSAINCPTSWMGAEGIHTMKAFAVERRLEFFSHGLLQILQRQEHRCGCHFFCFVFFSYALAVNIRRGALPKNNTSHHEENATHYMLSEETL